MSPYKTLTTFLMANHQEAETRDFVYWLPLLSTGVALQYIVMAHISYQHSSMVFTINEHQKNAKSGLFSLMTFLCGIALLITI